MNKGFSQFMVVGLLVFTGVFATANEGSKGDVAPQKKSVWEACLQPISAMLAPSSRTYLGYKENSQKIVHIFSGRLQSDTSVQISLEAVVRIDGTCDITETSREVDGSN